jgi:hypothetical protein
MRHLLDIVMPMFKRLPYKTFMPLVKEYRVSMVLTNMILYELICLLVPHQIAFDPLHLF